MQLSRHASSLRGTRSLTWCASLSSAPLSPVHWHMACPDPPSGSALTGTATALAVPKAQGAVMNYVPWRLLHEVRMARSTVHLAATSPSACCSGEGLPASVTVTAGSGGGTLKQSNLRQPQSAVLPVQERQVGPVGYSLDKGQKLLAEAGGDPSGPSSTIDWCGEGGGGVRHDGLIPCTGSGTASARNETHPVPVPSTYASSKEPRARGRGERAYTTSMQIGHTQRLVTGSGWHHTACGPSSTC